MPMGVSGRRQASFYAQQLRNVPKESRPRIRKALVEVSKDIRDDQARRSSWSSRIPGAIGLRIGWGSARVDLRVNSRRAPHAKPLEGPGKVNRHPVGGNRENWVSQPTRPFFNPAFARKLRVLRERIERALIESLPR